MYVCMYNHTTDICAARSLWLSVSVSVSLSLFISRSLSLCSVSFRLRIFMWPPAASPLPWSRAKNASRPDPYGFYRPRILQHAGVGFAPELAKKNTLLMWSEQVTQNKSFLIPSNPLNPWLLLIQEGLGKCMPLRLHANHLQGSGIWC